MMQIVPFATEVVASSMVDILIGINYKPRCLLPDLPRMIDNSSLKNYACHVDTNIIWP